MTDENNGNERGHTKTLAMTDENNGNERGHTKTMVMTTTCKTNGINDDR